MIMRLLLSIMTAFVLLCSTAVAVDFSDPRSVVEAAYAPYLAGDDFDWSSHDESALRSEGLNALYARDAEEADGEIGRIDFDPLINAQDYDIERLTIGPAQIEGERAVVEVTFQNMGEPQHIRMVLVEEDGGYRIDDVQSPRGEYAYSLREILEAPLQR